MGDCTRYARRLATFRGALPAFPWRLPACSTRGTWRKRQSAIAFGTDISSQHSGRGTTPINPPRVRGQPTTRQPSPVSTRKVCSVARGVWPQSLTPDEHGSLSLSTTAGPRGFKTGRAVGSPLGLSPTVRLRFDTLQHSGSYPPPQICRSEDWPLTVLGRCENWEGAKVLGGGAKA